MSLVGCRNILLDGSNHLGSFCNAERGAGSRPHRQGLRGLPYHADSKGRIPACVGQPTGFSAQGMLSTSVITPKTIDSEPWAKPYYILGPYWTAQHKQKDFRVFFCEDKPGTRCEWLQ
jgi:hypothetical protein